MSATRTFDSVVIGGGLNGLAAAGVLARAGQSVCLLERAPHLGGMAAPDASGAPRMAHQCDAIWGWVPATGRSRV
jgi:flavin-dependent dehydrogenase